MINKNDTPSNFAAERIVPTLFHVFERILELEKTVAELSKLAPKNPVSDAITKIDHVVDQISVAVEGQ